MLTEHDKQVLSETGTVSAERLRALAYALRAEAVSANTAAHDGRRHPLLAKVLRGKGLAYADAALMVERIAAGYSLRPRNYSPARRKTLAARAARRLRGDQQDRQEGSNK